MSRSLKSPPRILKVYIEALTGFSQEYCQDGLNNTLLGFPGGVVVKNLPANARDMGSSPGPGRSHMPRSN